MKPFKVVLIVCLIIACNTPKKTVSSTPVTPVNTGPSQMDADRGALKFPGYTLADLSEGKTIYDGHCNKCHAYKLPQSRDEAAWDNIIPKMAKKSKLDSLQESLVLKYVVTMSQSQPK